MSTELKDTLTIDPRVEFWSDTSRWPRRDCGTFTFLTYVVLDLGPLIYKEWTGDEPKTVLIAPLWPALDTTTPQDDIKRGAHALYYVHQGYRQRADAAREAKQPPPMPTPDEWAIACGIWRQLSDESYAAYNRYRHVTRVLVSVFELNFVVTAFRGHLFGGMREIPAGLWMNECFESWFATCQVDPEMPFSRTVVRFGGDWIYVEVDSYLAWRDTAFKHRLAQRDEAKVVTGSETSTAPETEASDNAASTPPETEVNNDASPTETAPSPDVAQMPATRLQRGTKPKYDWKTFEEEVLRRMALPQHPRSIHKLAEAMLSWCQAQWGKEPSNSRVRARISKILASNGLSLE